ncbi:MAG TPA: hypothetical protein VLD63_02855 [Anaerolineales bacterium]|nr:hypothetical protein [Anaerolineales bacterium]
MVHALESIHRLLKTNGSLLDIHPVADVALVKVLNAGKQVFSELYPSESGEDFRAADRAIDLIVERGLFRLDRSTVVDFLTHASSTSELKEFHATADAYDTRPSEGPVEARRGLLYSRVDRALEISGPGAELVYHEVVRMTHLKPVH